jgi:SHS family lactate transporter-like MFS transporter
MQPWWKEPTKGQWITFLGSWLGWVLDAFDFTVFLLVLPEISKEFGVGYAATASTITLTLLCRLAGGFVAGSLADKLGRKAPLMISLAWFAACDAAVAFAPSFTWILVFRTLFGFGMGAEWTAGMTIAMENWPARSRGIASGVLQGSWAIGYLLAAVVSGYVVPLYGWRQLFIVAALPALLIIPFRFFVPESEEWKRQQEEKAADAASGTTRAPVGFSPEVIRHMGWAIVVMTAAFSAYYGLTGMYPTLLKTELGQRPGDVSSVVSMFNVGMMLGAVFCGWLAAKRSITLAILIPALSCILVLPLYVGVVPGLLTLGAFLGGMFGGGYSGVTPILLTSLFPSEIRGRAVGIVYHVGAFGAAFVPMGIAQLVESFGLSFQSVIGVAVGVFQGALVVALLFVPAQLADVVGALARGRRASLPPVSAADAEPAR